MNDADLGDNIQHHADVAESHLPRRYRFQNDAAHLEPSRWWFASSAFPMIAGTLGPVASAFSICALVRPWRQYSPPGTDIQTATFIDDPPWLTTVNAIQLVMALISNVFLLLNMARRVRFIVAQYVTIVGWLISSLLLTALVATAAGPLKSGLPEPADLYVWSQAFYYGVWAAILYFLNAALMTVTFWGAMSGHYGRDFELTASQRTLMLQTIMFLFYLLLGALVFSNIEDWSYLDAVYWADVTLFTVGFGDFTPQTALGKALMMPYALVGVISLGLVIASIRSLILERGKRRMEARVEEKQRRRIVRAMTLNGNDFILSPMKKNEPTSLNEASHAGTPLNELERRKAEFELMRKIQAQALSRRRWISMAISTGTWLVLWFVGAVVFRRFEKEYQKWNYFDGVYFCFVTLTTIGYGDVTPISNGGKSFFVFWSLLALPTMTVLISNAGDTVVKLIRDATITLGNITILPSDEGVKGNIMRIVHKLTRGSVFPDYRPPQEEQIEFGDVTDISDADEAPASNRSEKPAESDDNPTRGRTNFLDPEKAESSERPPLHSPTPTTFTSQIRRSLSRFRDPLNELPTGTDFHFLLISEIQAVTRHLRGSKPRRYNFEEWAWYLKLIGEDESNPENHLKPRPKPPRSARLRGQHGSKDFRRHEHCSQDNELRNTTEHSAVEGEVFKWSWVGHRSPLMGSQEESEWILDRLTHRLRESLSAERRRQLKQKPTNSSRPAFRKYGPKRVGTGYGSGMKQNKAPPR